jgi:hypothetical protein
MRALEALAASNAKTVIPASCSVACLHDFTHSGPPEPSLLAQVLDYCCSLLRFS